MVGEAMKKIELTKLPSLDYPTIEGINTLCTNLSFSGRNIKKILVTSCHAGDGKTFIAMNLLRFLANNGKRVCLVDSDMRRSQLVAEFGVKLEKKPLGLAHYLAEQCDWESIINQTNIDGGYIVFHGQSVANPHALLTTVKLSQLMSQLERMFDIIIVDSPPIGLVIDAAEIAKCCDGILFVLTNNTISRSEMSDSMRQLDRTGVPILGSVMNKVTFNTHSSKKHYYKSYYSHYKSGYYE
jgi:capsular exopolysaccharide synthesis family protein